MNKRILSKKRWFGVFLILGFLVALAQTFAGPLLGKESSRVLKEFQQAQKTEIKIMQQKQKLDFKSLKANQSSLQAEWDKKETQERHKFFEAHEKGPDRRAYVQEYIERRKKFIKELENERHQLEQKHLEDLGRLKGQQTSKLHEFRKTIEKGETPSADLWPTGK